MLLKNAHFRPQEAADSSHPSGRSLEGRKEVVKKSRAGLEQFYRGKNFSR